MKARRGSTENKTREPRPVGGRTQAVKLLHKTDNTGIVRCRPDTARVPRRGMEPTAAAAAGFSFSRPRKTAAQAGHGRSARMY